MKEKLNELLRSIGTDHCGILSSLPLTIEAVQACPAFRWYADAFHPGHRSYFERPDSTVRNAICYNLLQAFIAWRAECICINYGQQWEVNAFTESWESAMSYEVQSAFPA